MLVDTSDRPIWGWNSYDGYGAAISEAEARENLALFHEKLQPAGYEYFCLDAAWYADGSAAEWAALRKQGRDRYMHIDEYGRYVPSPERFPSGLKDLADRCHALGLKFGVHMMRGFPRPAAEKNTPIKGTSYHVRDLLTPEDDCAWCRYWAAGDAAHPGMAAFYASEVEYLAEEIGVDFIKLDDVTEHPEHVKLFAEAVRHVKRSIVLSLSPGNEVWPGTYREVAPFANMIRITADVWDDDGDNLRKLACWHLMEDCRDPHCRIDMDMIPIGGLQVNLPPDKDAPLGAGRQSHLSEIGKRTLMTILALAGSPLVFGGALPQTSDADLAFVTHPGMLECDRDCETGVRTSFHRHLDVRRAPSRRDAGTGWLGLFNVGPRKRCFTVTARDLGFDVLPELCDVWRGTPVAPLDRASFACELEGLDCLFLKYRA